MKSPLGIAIPRRAMFSNECSLTQFLADIKAKGGGVLLGQILNNTNNYIIQRQNNPLMRVARVWDQCAKPKLF